MRYNPTPYKVYCTCAGTSPTESEGLYTVDFKGANNPKAFYATLAGLLTLQTPNFFPNYVVYKICVTR